MHAHGWLYVAAEAPAKQLHAQPVTANRPLALGADLQWGRAALGTLSRALPGDCTAGIQQGEPGT